MIDVNDEVLLLDKPSGMSSFGLVARARRLLSQQVDKKVKVGHAGTLDPFATGLMILLVGKACKQADTFLKLNKRYEVTAILGQTSSTGDPEGELTKVSDQVPTKAEVANALQRFQGEIQQTPPIFSAIKVGGRRAYDLARKGQEVKIAPRTVTIHTITLKTYDYPKVTFVCDVSSGTYIRSLVQDVGEVLHIGAYTSALRRTKIGQADINDAKTLENLLPIKE